MPIFAPCFLSADVLCTSPLARAGVGWESIRPVLRLVGRGGAEYLRPTRPNPSIGLTDSGPSPSQASYRAVQCSEDGLENSIENEKATCGQPCNL